MRNRYSHAPAVLLLLLAGCAPSAESPSLAPRAVEREFTDAPPPTGPCAQDSDGCYKPAEPAPVPIADDAALRARIAELSSAAAKGQSAFATVLPAANSAAGRAGETGSDAWVGAQQEFSRLEAARAATLDALSALDVLVVERAGQPTSAADFAALSAAAAEARRLSDAQQVEIERLRNALSRP